MSLYGAIDKMKMTSIEKDERSLILTIGRVVDTNDPNQMGRIRVYIPKIDRDTLLVGDIPYAMYCSPFAGHQQVQARGPEESYTSGPVAYGWFGVPKVGTDVVVGHLDGNPQYRFWFGALQGQYLSNTQPHGRFTFNNPANPGELDGPLSSTEDPIQPQYDNITTAYTRSSAVAGNDTATDTSPRVNFEYRTRGMDYQASGLGPTQQTSPTQVLSAIPDDRQYSFTEEDGNAFKHGNFTQGYARSRVEPNIAYDPSLVKDGVNYDPQVYSMTTPGFHAWAMDDRPENCRMRFRTTSGHTIILDDTNERIYIATAEGNNWVEMDQDGSIDVYSSRRVSIHAAMDVNIKTEGTFRVDAAKGIHLNSGGDVRVTSGSDAQISASGNINTASGGHTSMSASGDFIVKTGATLSLSSSGDTHINTRGTGAWTTQNDMNLYVIGGNLLTLTADPSKQVSIDDPTTVRAQSGTTTKPSDAYLNNRVPEHEPWARVMMKQSSTDGNSGNSYQLELDYDSPKVGRYELGQTIPRNTNWHR